LSGPENLTPEEAARKRKKSPREVVKGYRDDDIPAVMALATKLLEAEGKRVETLERKGTQLTGFGGISISLLSLTLSQAAHLPGLSVALFVAGVLTMAFAVYCGIRTVRTQMLGLPDETSISNHSSALEMQREHTQDLLYALRDQGEKGRKKGGWLQLGERVLNMSVTFLALAVLTVLFCQ
jgi:hypothetical protein